MISFVIHKPVPDFIMEPKQFLFIISSTVCLLLDPVSIVLYGRVLSTLCSVIVHGKILARHRL